MFAYLVVVRFSKLSLEVCSHLQTKTALLSSSKKHCGRRRSNDLKAASLACMSCDTTDQPDGGDTIRSLGSKTEQGARWMMRWAVRNERIPSTSRSKWPA